MGLQGRSWFVQTREILGAIAAIAAFVLYSLAAPALNFLSLRQMYFDFESGDYVGSGMHVFLYSVLFIFAYMLRRLWQSWKRNNTG
jgi:uncharacterized membrane protein